MARFFFHLRDSTGYLEDEEGEDLQDLDAVRVSARDAARSIISEESKQGLIDLRTSIEVTDEAGTTVLELPFSEAVDVRTGPPPGGREEREAAG